MLSNYSCYLLHFSHRNIVNLNLHLRAVLFFSLSFKSDLPSSPTHTIDQSLFTNFDSLYYQLDRAQLPCILVSSGPVAAFVSISCLIISYCLCFSLHFLSTSWTTRQLTRRLLDVYSIRELTIFSLVYGSRFIQPPYFLSLYLSLNAVFPIASRSATPAH